MVDVTGNERFLFAGDSITVQEWFTDSNLGLIEILNRQWPSENKLKARMTNSGGIGVARLGPGAVRARIRPIPSRTINVTKDGINGSNISQLATAITTRILNHNPEILIIHGVINDVGQGTNVSAFIASYTNIFTTVQAAIPQIKIICLSALCYFENWVAGPSWGNTEFNPKILELDTALETLCNSYGVEYVDLRESLLEYESIYNAPPPGLSNSRATYDGIHPQSAGRIIMGRAVFSHLRIIP